jgi:23S rRNA (cytosine1962-C5)-methyltransferase
VHPVGDYELLDVGGGARLERFGGFVTDRPHGGALSDRHQPGAWSAADLRFDRDRGWSGSGLIRAADGWSIGMGGIELGLRPTEAGQVGVFPEHESNLSWLDRQLGPRLARGADVHVLNLFAYTGLATLSLARQGAHVTHVDAARPTVAWARENADRNRLQDRPIRWIVDDARSYAARELRRDRRYDGIVVDPPTYGHGSRGSTAWRLADDLPTLLATMAQLLTPDGFVLLTAHTEGFGAERLTDLLVRAFGPGAARRIDAGETERQATSGARLGLGACARMDGRSG